MSVSSIGCGHSLSGEGSSLLPQRTFPARVEIFPVPRVGNFTRNALRMLAFNAAQGTDFDKIPCIFPEIRELGPRDTFAAASQHMG